MAAAILLTTCGLVASFMRLRREFDRAIASLTLVLLVGATPLLGTIRLASLAEAALFTLLAVITYFSSSVVRPLLLVASIVLPFVAPEVAVRPTLFAPWNGLLALTPVVYIAVLGTAARARSAPYELAAVVIAFVVWPLTSTSLVPALALLAPGLAAVLAWARTRPLIAVTPLVLGVLLWNYWLMVQYTAGTIPKDAPVSFAAMVRQQGDAATRQPFVYPFAFPGNLLSAWRIGIPLSRYDLLAGEPRREHFDLRIDRGADRFLLEGWGPLGSTRSGSFRFVIEPRATLVFPLAPHDGPVDVTLVAAAEAPTEATLVANGYELGRVHVAPDAPAESRLRMEPADVGRILRAGYNRLTIVTPGSRRIAIYRLRIAPAA
jgi:hypothetical protein